MKAEELQHKYGWTDEETRRFIAWEQEQLASISGHKSMQAMIEDSENESDKED